MSVVIVWRRSVCGVIGVFANACMVVFAKHYAMKRRRLGADDCRGRRSDLIMKPACKIRQAPETLTTLTFFSSSCISGGKASRGGMTIFESSSVTSGISR